MFEINRDKSEIPNFPTDVIHICWLVDFWGRGPEDFKGSDILYTWGYNWIDNLKENGITMVKHLPPATDSEIYKPLDSKKNKIYDCAYMGHIPKKWSNDELNRHIGFKDNEKIYFRDITTIAENIFWTNPHYGIIHELKILGFDLCLLNKTLIYDIEGRIGRLASRMRNINLFLEKTNKIAIYGPENWLLYNKYKNYYKNFLENPKDINKAMQDSSIIIHTHYQPHFRVFDAMSCGIVTSIMNTPKIYQNEFELLGFKSGEDYVEIDIKSDNLNPKIFSNKKLLSDISHNARKKTLENHLWVHRAEQVLKDVEGLYYE